MKIRRFAAVLLAVALAAAGITGCSGKKDKDAKGGQEAMGRYVEEPVELPVKEGENVIALTAGEESDSWLYTYNTLAGTYGAYHYEDGNFTEGDAAWLDHAGSTLGEFSNIVRGEDGKLYALFFDNENKSHVVRDAGDGTSEEIVIPELASQGDMDMYPIVSNMAVDSDGNLFLAFPVTGEVRMYDQKTGDLIRSFQSGEYTGVLSMLMDVSGKDLIMGNQDGTGFIYYDTATGEVRDEIKYADMTSDGIVKINEENDCIYADSKGLHHLTKGGSVAEDLISENASAFGIPQAGAINLVETEKGTYLVLFHTQTAGGETTYQLYRYVYDKTAKAKPSQMLTVYGLTESSAVRQAIAKFQQDNPDVGIEYKTGSAGEGTGTKADSIRALNTELLGGSGADVIMLDGLPAESYIEKGILADLGGILDAVDKEDGISANITDPYEKNGKIYQIPTRYGVPILMGSSEKARILKSSNTLIDYMKDHKWNDLMEMADKNKVMGLLLNIYYDEIVDEKQSIDTELLASLIETAGKTVESDGVEGTIFFGGGSQTPDSGWNVGKVGSLEETDTIASYEIKGIQSMMMPYHYMRKTGTEPTDTNGIYTPHDLVGINKASKNTELAREFVKTLLSKDVQTVDVDCGFPVNEKAMEALIQSLEEEPDEANGSVSISSAASATDGEEDETEPVTENITLPHRSEVQSLADMGKKLKKPVQKDDIIGEMILDGAKTYFDGSRTAEEAAKDIAEKADTYLSE
ncbi:hypothetical protein GCM10008910_21260 [Faecalicatena orotica]|uniref:Extracellular solute-binding protein n=1 Tax=Faecalicatena orotica TaxID=1544 RepID=A0A2Y9BBS0_9FIRM|nr:extracellular solute-binding protein [Faecalicatena orotica]PWJ32354.1 extracellular solute-binding protein [Faecalicatena orotica]SSA54188.1 extracellular solute-binding protein [Faecalicatena orotica]